jgi:hypothetical protein
VSLRAREWQRWSRRADLPHSAVDTYTELHQSLNHEEVAFHDGGLQRCAALAGRPRWLASSDAVMERTATPGPEAAQIDVGAQTLETLQCSDALAHDRVVRRC